MIRALIVEDEFMVRETLTGMLARHFGDSVEVIGECGSVPKAKELILELKPDLVFLDIELSFGTGFDLLESLQPVGFQVIFITAYSQYAIKAIKFAAVDYLLKPLDPDELKQALARVKMREHEPEPAAGVKHLVTNQAEPNVQLHKFSLSTTRGIRLLVCQEVLRCEADASYTHFYLVDGSKETVSKTLKTFADRFSDHGFYRVHHSHLINLSHIRQFLRQEGGFVEMTDGSLVPISRRKKAEFLKILSGS